MMTRLVTVVAAVSGVLGCSKGTEGPGIAEIPTTKQKGPEHGRPDPSATGTAGPAEAASRVGSSESGRHVFGPFSIQVPKGWQETQATSSMRAAQFTLTGSGGDAELVVYYFGKGGAGAVESNLQRWYGQFEQPDKSSSADAAKIEKLTAGGMAVTTVDLSGTYVASLSPGAAERHNAPKHRMLAAIVESSQGPYYFKLLGPESTLEEQREVFLSAIRSITTEP